MSTESSVARSPQPGLCSGSVDLPRYSFVQQSENVNSSKARRAVRSHAMKAVRRQQRQESGKTFRLKWPEEHSSGKSLRSIRPHEQSSTLEERRETLQLEGRIQTRSQEGNITSGTPLLQWSESVGNVDEYDPLQVDPQISVHPPSERATFFDALERQELSPYNTAKAGEEFMPSGIYARTLLGAGRIDPFQTLPIRPDRSLPELVDHCMFPSHQFD